MKPLVGSWIDHLHDTPARGLFCRSDRNLSHGCPAVRAATAAKQKQQNHSKTIKPIVLSSSVAVMSGTALADSRPSKPESALVFKTTV